MKQTARVWFSCRACGWRVDVPDEHVVTVDGLPRSAVTCYHECPSGAPDVEERAAIDGELRTTTPALNIKFKL